MSDQDQLQLNQQAPSDPPPGIDDYIAGLQKQDQPTGLDQYVGGLLADASRQHDAAYRSGQLALSPKEVFVNQLLSQQGKGAAERAWDKMTSIPEEVVKSAPGFWQGIKNAVASEWQKSQDEAKQPFLQNLKEGFEQPYRMAVAGAAGSAKAIPATLETLYDTQRVANPVLAPIYAGAEKLFPNAMQKMEAAENAATSAATHYTNVPVNAAVQASGADTNRLDAKIAEQAIPLAVMGAFPMGEAGELEQGIANASTSLVRGVQKGSAYVDRTAAQAMQKPIVNKAVNAGVGMGLGAATGGALGGHGFIGELVGGFLGWLRGGKANEAAQALLKTKYQDVVDNANAIINSDAAPWEAVKQPLQKHIDKLQQESDLLRKDLDPKSAERLDAVNSNGEPAYQTKNLSSDAKRVRENQDDISNLKDKIAAIDKRVKANQFFDDATRYLTGLGLHAGLGAGIGAGFAGATSPPGDTSQMGGSAMVGGMLGLGGGLFGVPKGMQAERATQNAKIMNDVGSKLVPQDPNLRPEAQSNVNKLAAVAAPAGYSVEVVTPDQYLQRPEVIKAAQTSPQEAGIVQAPNGHIDTGGKRIVLNLDAANSETGVEWHEYEHLLQKLYGRALRENAPPNLTNNFDQAYQDRMSETGKVSHNTEDERDAEVGRILLQNTPIENFYGGKRLFDVLDPSRALSWIGSKLLPGYKVDPTLQAPYNRADMEAMRGQMFQAGADAAKAPRSAPTSPSAISPQLGEQTQPSAPTEAPIKSVEQVVSEVDRAARPRVIPAGGVNPQDAVDFLVTMGETKEGAEAKAHAAVQDLRNEGSLVTLENIVKKALQRTIPKPVESVVNEVDQAAKSIPPNEEPSRTPTETVPQTPTEPTPERGVEGEIQAPAVQAGHPDYEAIGSEAETAKREELAGTRRKTKEQEISRAGLEAMAQAHAKHVGDTDLVTWRTDRFGDTSIGGKRLDLDDPFHQHLIEKAGLTPKQVEYVNQFSENMGKLLGLENYSHAAKEGEATGVSRKTEQKESTAQQRAEKQGDTQNAPVNIVATWIKFNQPSNRVTVHGFNPDKFLSNGAKLESYPESGFKKAYPKGVNDPQIVKDLSDWLANNRNGYTGDGRKQIEGTPLTQVKPNADYKPVIIPHDRFQVLNAMMGSPEPMGKTPKSADAQILGQQNAGFVRPSESIFNQVRAKLAEKSDVRDLLENVNESLRPENISGKVNNEPVADEHLLRPSGATPETVKAIADVIGEKGTPRFSQSGFMPATPKPFESIAKQNGLIYNGEMEGKLHLFSDPQSKTTFSVPINATPEQLQKKLEVARQRMSGEDVQFMPSTNPKAIKEAAIKMPDDKIFSDFVHPLAYAEALSSYPTKQLSEWLDNLGEDFAVTGFVTNDGEFLTRDQALQRGKELKQFDDEGIKEAKEHFGNLRGGGGGLEALNFLRARQFSLGGVVARSPLSRATVKKNRAA